MKSAESLLRGGDRRLDICGDRDVARDEMGHTALRFDFAGDALSGVRVAVRDDHPCTFASELQRRLASDSAAGAGHDRYAPVQASAR